MASEGERLPKYARYSDGGPALSASASAAAAAAAASSVLRHAPPPLTTDAFLKNPVSVAREWLASHPNERTRLRLFDKPDVLEVFSLRRPHPERPALCSTAAR
jgi:hypothetical protein